MDSGCYETHLFSEWMQVYLWRIRGLTYVSILLLVEFQPSWASCEYQWGVACIGQGVPLIPAKELVIKFHALCAFALVKVVHVELSEGAVPAWRRRKNWSVWSIAGGGVSRRETHWGSQRSLPLAASGWCVRGRAVPAFPTLFQWNWGLSSYAFFYRIWYISQFSTITSYSHQKLPTRPNNHTQLRLQTTFWALTNYDIVKASFSRMIS